MRYEKDHFEHQNKFDKRSMIERVLKHDSDLHQNQRLKNISIVQRKYIQHGLDFGQSSYISSARKI